MQVIKPQKLINSEQIWQFEDDERFINVFDDPSETWLIFGIFFLDKFDNNSQAKLSKLLEELHDEIDNWNRFYPWSEYNGIHLRLEKTAQDVSFIFGQICVEDNVMEEESIVVALIAQFSFHCKDSQVFIKVCDTDGDFILAEANDSIPTEYEYPVSINRLWIHDGKCKIIPNEYCADRGLKPEESLNFLRDNYYKLIVIDGIQNKFTEEIIGKYPESFLNNMMRLPIIIEDSRTMNMISSSPQIISFALKNLINEEIDVQDKVNQVHNNHHQELLVPKRFIDLLSIFLDSRVLKTNSSDIPLYCGRAITGVLNSLLESSTIFLEENEKTSSMDDQGNDIFHLHEFKPASLDSPFPINDNKETAEDIVEGLTTFFRGEDGKELDSERDSQDEAFDEDERAKQLFRNENIDIDEDDFFEFFLTDALKMNKENIEALRSHDITDNIMRTPENPDFSDNSDDLLDDSEALEGLSPSALSDLLKAMTVDGVTDGPLQSILRHTSKR